MIVWQALIRVILLTLVILETQMGVARSAPASPLPAPTLAGVATDRAGHVYVADARQGRIYVLSPNLQLLTVWTIPRPRGPFGVHPEGVAVDRRGAIYATDLNDRIFKLTSRGAVQAEWGSPGSGPG